MQITPTSNTMNTIPTFKGLGHVFKKKYFKTTKEVVKLAEASKSNFIGTLPKDIINIVKEIAPTKKEKNNLIKQTMHVLGAITKDLQDPSNPRAINNAQSNLTKALHNLGILKTNEKVRILPLGTGGFGDVYNIKFSKSSNISDKIIKIFSPAEQDIRINTHGLLPETNTAFYIANKIGKNVDKTPFIKFHFASIKDSFYFAENVNNYKKLNTSLDDIEQYCKNNLSIKHYDLEGNVENGRIFDYGGMYCAEPSNNTRLDKKFIRKFKQAKNLDEYMIYMSKIKTLAKKNKISNANEIADKASYYTSQLDDLVEKRKQAKHWNKILKDSKNS